MNREVKCPRCHKSAVFSPENPYRPFCSERCKLIDLGQWAEEKYAIPTTPTELEELTDASEESDETEQTAEEER